MKQVRLMAQEEILLKTKIRVIFYNHWLLCAMTAALICVMNYFCRTNDSDVLKWILTPTAWWAGILGGIYFEYLPHQGYVNYFHQFLIAPSCAGSRFMLLTFLMLVFSFRLSDYLCGNRRAYSEQGDGLPLQMHKIRKEYGYEKNTSMQKEYLWFGFSIVFSYLSTVFVNGIRIVASVYLPDILERMNLLDGWLTPDRLHTLIGTVTYFSFLCVIYWIAIWLRGCSKKCDGPLVPVFWYLLIVLALPFIKRMYHNEWEGFGQYAVLIVSVCGSVYVLLVVVGRIRRRRN